MGRRRGIKVIANPQVPTASPNPGKINAMCGVLGRYGRNETDEEEVKGEKSRQGDGGSEG